MEAALREARTGSLEDLETLLVSVRRALEGLGERLPARWTEEAVDDLRNGRLSGWYRPPSPDGGGIGFFSRRAGRAYGHVHVLPGPDLAGRASVLADAVASDPSLSGLVLHLGLTGLGPTEEAAVAAEWRRRAGRTEVRREGRERSLGGAGPVDGRPLPASFRPVRVRDVTEEALADLDLRGFADSPDAFLFASDRAEYARMVGGILGGRLGGFLDPASTAVLAPDGRLAGFLLSVELSPRVGLFADLVVDPALRRRGIGEHLLRWGLRALGALGYSSAQLWVTEGNAAARALYDRLGFRTFASTGILVQGGADAPGHPQRAP